MTAVPADFAPIDPGRIEATDPVEIAYWSAELGCSAEVLADVVGRVGPHVAVVREALAGSLQPGRRAER
jgi:hypothetical protein